MSLAESAIVIGFQWFRVSLLIVRRVVVPLFAFRTCQCNSCAHDFHLHFHRCLMKSFPFSKILSIKKRPLFFHSPNYYIICAVKRQSFFIENHVWLWLSPLFSAHKQRQTIDFLHAHLPKDPGAGLHGAACGVDVIHQKNPPRAIRKLSRPEGLSEIHKPFPGPQLLLRHGFPTPI